MVDVTRRDAVKIGGATMVIGTLGSTSVSAENEREESAGISSVRAAHLSPDAPNVDVYVGGIRVLSDVAFGTVSPYSWAISDTYRAQVVPTSEHPDEAVIDAEVELQDRDYTVAAIGEVGGENQPLEPLVLEDDNRALDPDTARIRAVHAAPDAPEVDILAGEDPLFEGVGFGESGYAEVPSGEYAVEIYPAGEREEAAFTIDVSLEAETVYSAFAVGYLAPEDAPVDEPFDVVLTEDAMTGSEQHDE